MKTRPPDVVLSSSMAQLLKQIDARYAAIASMTSRVEMNACTGGGIEGQQTCVLFSGYIVISKPENINVILLVPVLGSTALNMVSDGKTFKMKIPPKNCYILGSDIVTNSSQKGLYALRPSAILDSLLVQGFGRNQIVSMTQDSRTLSDPRNRKGLILEPDYDIEFLSQPTGQVANTLRVLHISRIDLLPYRQDIYNSEGKVATQAFYSNYQRFGDFNFPTRIQVERPLDELSLTITFTRKPVFNEALSPGQFEIDSIPESYTTYNMDDPRVAATVPCGAHALQSPH